MGASSPYNLDAIRHRTLVIGNSGSGKTTVAMSIGMAFGVPTIDLDSIFWEGKGYGSKRDKEAALQMVKEIVSTSHWIIEGVYPWLLEPAMERATAIVWLDLNWDDCRSGQLTRGKGYGSEEEFQKNMAYSESYWTRDTGVSFAGHLRIYADFNGVKLRFKHRAEIDDFLRAFSRSN